MIAGYDYLSLRLKKVGEFWNRTRLTAATLLVTGGVLLGVGTAYYGYADDARDDLAKYEVPAVEIAPAWAPPPPAAVIPPVSQPFVPEISMYSGDAGADPDNLSLRLPEGFVLINFTQATPLNSAPPATRLTITSLDIDSSVEELSIIDLGERRVYETPNNTVGHIPGTANAGELGQGWYFGHTESPILDEGSVFFNLQQIPAMLRLGENVDIIADNGTEQFLYRVTQTRVVHEDELALETGGGPTIHLVSCVPRLVYDHRLIVDAQLIAHRQIG